MPGIVPNLSKAARVLSSALAPADKFRYLRHAFTRRPASHYRLSGGGAITLRPGTTDIKVFDEVFIDRVYAAPLATGPRDVRTIVDLGANIGLSAIALLRAFPEARAVAVEPDPGNFRVLEENLRSSGLSGRCRALHAFAGANPGVAELVDSGNGAWGMRMGPPSPDGIPVMTLAGIARHAGMGAISLLKCDIEGAERHLFTDLAHWDELVRYVVLELHTDLFPVEEFEAALGASTYDWTIHGLISDRSPLSVIGLERGAPHWAPRAASAR